MMLADALVVSDFPIIGMTAESVLGVRYRVERKTWQAFLEQDNSSAGLVIVDVTALDRETALRLVGRMLPGARAVICSLHQNEVEVYRLGEGGAQREAAYPSLLALVA